MDLCDTHCHIQSVGSGSGERSIRDMWAKADVNDVDSVIQRAAEAGVNRMICVGCDVDDSQQAAQCAETRDGCWASIGIHPHEATRYVDNLDHSDSGSLKTFTDLCSHPKVVAVGECGLDYFYDHSPKEAQVALLNFQCEIAITDDLPIIFHVREAFEDFWPIFERYTSNGQSIRGVLHSFTDSLPNLERAIKHGLYIGVNGIATFATKPHQRDMYNQIPLQNLVLETDAPFLTPHPYRGKVCEPYHIRTIAEFLANQRNESMATLATATTANAQRLFRI